MNKWTINNFSECIDPVRIDRSRQVKAATYLTAGKYPIVDQGQSDITGWTDDVSTVISENLPYIIFGDHTRIFKYVDFPFALGADGTKLIKPRSDINPRYFYYYLLLLDIPSKGYSRHYQLLKEKDISLPPFPEQEKIAAVLLKLQNAILIQEKIIQSLRDLKKSTMNFVFSRGLHGEKTKYTPIGEIPESWEVKDFVNLATLHRGYDLPVQERIEGSIPIIGSNGIVGHHNVAKVKAPGVVTGRSGSIGISYYVDVDYWPLNTGLYVSDFNNNNPLFVHYYFESFDFKKYAAGVSVPTLNRNLVHSVKIAIPMKEEQVEIAKVLGSIDKKYSFHQSKKSSLQDLFKTILNKLMTGEIRVGELDIDVESVKI